MNIVLTFDKNRHEEAKALIHSISIHNPFWELFVVHLGGEDFTLQMIREIYLLKKDTKFIYIYPEFISYISLSSPNLNTPFGVTSYVRLGLPLYWGLKHLDKCLYLDTDVLVYKDLSEIYNQNVDNVDVLGFQDIASKSSYIVSGVLLYNLDRLRKSTRTESGICMFNTHHHRNPDQDIINLHYERKAFDSKFGYCTSKSVEPFPEDPVLRHFYCWKEIKPTEDGGFRVYKPWEHEEHEHRAEWMYHNSEANKIIATNFI